MNYQRKWVGYCKICLLFLCFWQYNTLVLHAFKFLVPFMPTLIGFSVESPSSVYDWKLIFGWQINYAHIKACLVMQSCGISPEGLLPSSHQDKKTDERMNGASTFSGSSTLIQKEEPCVIETPSNGEEEISASLKRQKVCESKDERRVPVKATESLLVEWLKNNDGVSDWSLKYVFIFLMLIFPSPLWTSP